MVTEKNMKLYRRVDDSNNEYFTSFFMIFGISSELAVAKS